MLKLTEAGIAARERAAELVGNELATRIDARLDTEERHALTATLRKLRLHSVDAAMTTTKGTN